MASTLTAALPATATAAATTPAATRAAPAVGAPGTTTTIHHVPGDHTAAVILLVVVAGLLLAGALTWVVASRAAKEPEWLLRARHATGEAGWRISNTWAAFVDFLRLGR
jgi:hypothetical protein